MKKYIVISSKYNTASYSVEEELKKEVALMSEKEWGAFFTEYVDDAGAKVFGSEEEAVAYAKKIAVAELEETSVARRVRYLYTGIVSMIYCGEEDEDGEIDTSDEKNHIADVNPAKPNVTVYEIETYSKSKYFDTEEEARKAFENLTEADVESVEVDLVAEENILDLDKDYALALAVARAETSLDDDRIVFTEATVYKHAIGDTVYVCSYRAMPDGTVIKMD